jgi:prepilin-type processing-associated H-X9-DG protein
LSFAPPGGMRRSSRLYVAWQDGHVTRMWDW